MKSYQLELSPRSTRSEGFLTPQKARLCSQRIRHRRNPMHFAFDGELLVEKSCTIFFFLSVIIIDKSGKICYNRVTQKK